MKINYVKLDRLAAWALLILMLVFLVSGFGLTKGLINYQLAAKLHLGWLAFLLLAAFSVHTFYAIRLALMRHGFWNKNSRLVLIIVYLIFVLGFVYVAGFYQPVVGENYSQSASQSGATTTQNTSGDSVNQREFTLAQLAQYNGQNGQPAYVAVDGLVYDLSSVFRNGEHRGHRAGQDLSAAFHSVHGQEYLSRYPIVGQLK